MRIDDLRARRVDWILLLVVATAVLLPVLGLLQYRWLEQWSSAERERMRSTLTAGVFLLGEEVDRAVAAASETFDLRGVAPDERAAALEARRASWRERAPYPELVASVEVVEAPAGAARRQVLCGDARAGRPPTLVLPLEAPGGDGAASVVVTLDHRYLLDGLLPRLVAFFFTARDPSAQVAATVAEAGAGGRVLARYPVAEPATGPGREPAGDAPVRPLEHVDAAYNFLSLRIREWLSLEGTMGSAPEDRNREPPGCWTLRVAHRAGSVDAAVTVLRRRQMATSFGVLALLGITAVALAVAARRSARLSRQQLAFVAGVTHELRTPLSVIRSAGDNLARRVVSDADGVAEYGRVIRAEGRRLSEMVENVLRLSRVGYGGGESPRERVDPAEVIAAAVEECRGACEERRVTVEVDVHAGSEGSDAPPPIAGDRDALVCAVRNLLINAVKHGPDGGTVRIAVGAGRGAGSGRRHGTLAITVADQGRGIPESERGRVFDAFYQGRSARSDGVPGAGLGLALVRQVAELHGGTVEIESGPGGSTVRLALRSDPDPDPETEPGDA